MQHGVMAFVLKAPEVLTCANARWYVTAPELMARGLVLEDPRRDVVLMAQFSDSRLVVFVMINACEWC